MVLLLLGGMVARREGRGTGWRYGLVVANIAGVLVGGYGWGTANNDTVPVYHLRHMNEACHRRYMLTQDPADALGEGCRVLIDLEALNVLAYYDMAMFASLPSKPYYRTSTKRERRLLWWANTAGTTTIPPAGCLPMCRRMTCIT